MTSKIARVACVLWLWCLAAVVSASTLVIHEGDAFNRLSLRSHIMAFQGGSAPGDVEAASQLPDADFALLQGPALGLMETRWFRFRVHNSSAQTRHLVFDFDQALYSRLAWRSQVGADVRQFLTGQDFPASSRDIQYNYLAFRIDVPPGETLTADFSIYTPFAALFAPVLSDSESFARRLAGVWQFPGAVVGMLYSVILFLLIYIVRVPKPGAAYPMLAQVFFSLLSVLYLTGTLQAWLPGESAIEWRDILYLLIHGPQGLGYSFAVRSFFNTAANYPLLHRLLSLSIVATILHLLLIPVVPLDYLLVGILTVNTLMMIASVGVAALSLYRRQQGTALFASGLLLFVLTAFVSIAGMSGLFPDSWLTRYGYELGLTLQADFLFLAIATRIFTMERENLQMQADMLKLTADMQARSEFVERVTHDVKSPLSAVLGAEQLLRSTEDAASRQRYLDMIRASCSMVLNIIDDILSHSRLRQGQMVIKQEVFDLRRLVDDVEASLRASHLGSPLSFSVIVDPALPAQVVGDRLRVSQVLHNLLGNAFKFTDAGRIELKVYLAEQLPGAVQVGFVVQDTGIGMTPEFLEQAFDSYTREENRAGFRSGFGLGLAICHSLVQMMGGKIEVSSKPGQGSQFTVMLPFVLPDNIRNDS